VGWHLHHPQEDQYYEHLEDVFAFADDILLFGHTKDPDRFMFQNIARKKEQSSQSFSG
jgi:hypothetical protein